VLSSSTYGDTMSLTGAAFLALLDTIKEHR
jgi:hypothetical protein